jgi:hypothetical protein
MAVMRDDHTPRVCPHLFVRVYTRLQSVLRLPVPAPR